MNPRAAAKLTPVRCAAAGLRTQAEENAIRTSRTLLTSCLSLALAFAPAARPQTPQPTARPSLEGNWQGTLQGDESLRTILKISSNDGKLKGALLSIDQDPAPIAMTSISLAGTAVHFAITPLSLTYTGTLNPDGRTISGALKQGSDTHPLNLTKVSAEEMWAIPEPPKPMPKDAKPQFEVATIKPSSPANQGKEIDQHGRHLIAQNFNVDDLLALAYGLHRRQIVGAPDWFDSQLFDIDGVPDIEGTPSDAQTNGMLQGLLADRFQLKFHREQRELAVYAITTSKSGPKMTGSARGPDDGGDFSFGRLGSLTVLNMSIADFAVWMQASVMDRPVVDQTGLKDRFDFKLKWTPDDSQFAQFRSAGWTPQPRKDKANAPPDLYTAMQEQLGLKLQPIKAMTDVIVVDHVEKPSPN